MAQIEVSFRTLSSVHCAEGSKMCVVCIVKRTKKSYMWYAVHVRCVVYFLQCTMKCIQCSVLIVQSTLGVEQCAVWNHMLRA